jgi:7-cyano-7-deazaguanine synthase
MQPTCVLFSGGLDSAVLLAQELRAWSPVYPVHVRSGFAWEDGERRAIDRLLAMPAFAAAAPLSTITVDMRDVYPASHWAVTGRPPAYDTADEDVYLVGRNIVLLSKTAVLCARLGVERIALGPLANNPFPDASPEFFQTIGRALSLGLAKTIAIDTPLTSHHKDAVVKLGIDLGVPLELTLSCMNPQGDVHCGECSKCRERRDAFADAGVEDPTIYRVDWKRTV